MTDIIGFLLIFPLTRKLILKKFSSKFKVKTKSNENYIDGEYEDVEKEDDKNYKILAKFIKDMSSETPDVETYMYVKDHISQYQLGIDINSKAIKSRLIEVNTTIRFTIKMKTLKNQFLNLFIHRLYR